MSASRACVRAASASTVMNAFSDGFRSAMALRHRSVAVSAVSSRACSARANSAIVRGSAGIRTLGLVDLAGGIDVPISGPQRFGRPCKRFQQRSQG